jgi:2-methylcitrate dehydratase PrpD
VRCDTPRGSPENPLTRAQIEAKFRTYAKPRISTGRIEEVINIVSKLEDLPNVRNLMNLLRFTNEARGRAAAAA